MFGLAICMVLLDYPVILGFFRKGGRGTYKKNHSGMQDSAGIVKKDMYRNKYLRHDITWFGSVYADTYIKMSYIIIFVNSISGFGYKTKVLF